MLFELRHEDKQVITRYWDVTKIPGLGKSTCERPREEKGMAHVIDNMVKWEH